MESKVGICNFCGLPIKLTEEKKLVTYNRQSIEVFWLCLSCKNVNNDKDLAIMTDLDTYEFAKKFEELRRYK